MTNLLIALSVLFAGFSAQADFIENGAFYGVMKRHESIVIEDSEIYINAKVVQHRDFVEHQPIIADLTEDKIGLDSVSTEIIDSNWREASVIFSDRHTKESLALTFDIIHEI